MTVGSLDKQYYREVQPGSVAERIFIAARRRIFHDFAAQMRPTPSDQILDVGASDVLTGQTSWNDPIHFKRTLRRAGSVPG